MVNKINASKQKEIVAQNLNNLLDRYGKNVADVVRDLGLSDTTVRSWFKGTKYPRIDKVQLLADYFHVSRSDILEEFPNNIKRVTNVTRIPIIGTIACGDPITAEQNIDGYREAIADHIPNGSVFFLKCKGDSMSPTINDGSYVLIHEQPEVEDGEIAAVLVDNDSSATLKRIKHQNGMVILIPDNKNYSPIILSKEKPGRIIGKAIEAQVPLN